MHNHGILLSIKPEYIKMIEDGKKTVELRKNYPRKSMESEYLIFYSTKPIQKIVAVAKIEKILSMPVLQLWEKVEGKCGIDFRDYRKYFNCNKNAVGIFFVEKQFFHKPIALKDFQEFFPNFIPPQSYHYISIKELNFINSKFN